MEKSNYSNTKNIIGVVVVIVVLAGLGFIAYQNSNNPLLSGNTGRVMELRKQAHEDGITQDRLDSIIRELLALDDVSYVSAMLISHYDSIKTDLRKSAKLKADFREVEVKFITKDQINRDGSHRGAVEVIKSRMHDPSSFEHVSTEITPAPNDGSKYWVRIQFRGKNGFGALRLDDEILEFTNSHIYTPFNIGR